MGKASLRPEPFSSSSGWTKDLLCRESKPVPRVHRMDHLREPRPSLERVRPVSERVEERVELEEWMVCGGGGEGVERKPTSNSR